MSCLIVRDNIKDIITDLQCNISGSPDKQNQQERWRENCYRGVGGGEEKIYADKGEEAEGVKEREFCFK